MPRTVKEEENAQKRAEILDAAQGLIFAKGYEEMSIQDIVNELSISKGAFYHYYDSKPSLLEAVLDRIIDQVARLVTPIVQDPHERALTKMQRFFDSVSQWKAARKDFLLGLTRAWYSDKNALVRQKIMARLMHAGTPWMTALVRQGIAEGDFDTPYPDQIGSVTFGLVQSLGDVLAGWALAPNQDVAESRKVVAALRAYNDAICRLLGTPPGALIIMRPEVLKVWFGEEALVDEVGEMEETK